MKKIILDADYFFERCELDEKTGCWLWSKNLWGAGYGRMFIGRTGNKLQYSQYAYKAAYEYFIGQVPKGLELDHICKVKLCINPWHLRVATRSENAIYASGGTLTHCKRGHSRKDYTAKNGNCLLCARILNAKCRAERRALLNKPDGV